LEVFLDFQKCQNNLFLAWMEKLMKYSTKQPAK